MPNSLSPRRFATAAVLILAAVTAGACGGGNDDAPQGGGGGGGGGAAPAGPGKVTIKDFAFAPADLKVQAGTEVTWTNEDTAPHTATANDKSFDSKSMDQDATFTQKFEKAGTFEYFCTIHDYMKAKITVA